MKKTDVENILADAMISAPMRTSAERLAEVKRMVEEGRLKCEGANELREYQREGIEQIRREWFTPTHGISYEWSEPARPSTPVYQFPPTIFTRNSLLRQWFHLLSEVFEVGVALLRGNYTHAARETFDVRQSSETLTRILEKRGVDVAGMKDEVVAGNAARGYYR